METINILELAKLNKGGDNILDMEVCLDDLDWLEISDKNLTKEFIYRFADRLYWEKLLENKNNNIDQEFIEKIIEKDIDLLDIDWSYLTDNCAISEEFIEKYIDRFNLEFVGYFGSSYISEEFLIRHQDKLDWGDISSFRDLSNEFMKNNSELIIWSLYYSYNEYITLEKIKDVKIIAEINHIYDNNRIPSSEKERIIEFIETELRKK